jgi:hypothetical protein
MEESRTRYKNIVSEVFVPKALNSVFAHVEYKPKLHIPKEYIDGFLVQGGWDYTRGSDY